MTRNTVRRVEVAAPVYDKAIQKRIREMFSVMLSDDEKGREQDANGDYHRRKINEVPINSQEYFYEQAYANVRE